MEKFYPSKNKGCVAAPYLEAGNSLCTNKPVPLDLVFAEPDRQR